MATTATLTPLNAASAWRRINWPLALGLVLTSLVACVALWGPQLAPRDPLEESAILRAGERWVTPPFPVLTPGFPLGSDDLGRDLLSRVLWGIRPTLTIVVIVSAVRLALGVLIGLVAGWARGPAGRALDAAIALGLSIPVIMVALGGIAAVGVELGVWAFVIGLSLTGWVDTARLVRVQTASIRGQVYIEAARSLGASGLQILQRHVVRQIASMLWMLWAFEVSGTLMLTASLGFLGYYIGGDVWVQVTDATARAVSGAPELGQMLATSGNRITQPWSLVVIGGFVFLTVLGFNLLGEGLRRGAALRAGGRRPLFHRTAQRARLWLEERVLWPLSQSAASRSWQLAGLAAATLALGFAGWIWLRPGFDPRPRAGQTIQPEGPYWPSGRGDPAGTRWVPFVGPQTGELAWTLTDPQGFSGGPAVDQSGVVYAAGLSGALYAAEPNGQVRWRAPLPAAPVGGPALGSAGMALAAAADGSLTAFSRDGALLWRANADLGRSATAGPVVASDGTAYYPTGNLLHAVSRDGVLLWSTPVLGPGAGFQSALLDPQGERLFFENRVLSAADGSPLDDLDRLEADQFFFGANGSAYLLRDHDVAEWNDGPAGPQPRDWISWDYRGFTTAEPQTAGADPEGLIWLYYSSFARGFGFGVDTRLVWLDRDGNRLGNLHYPTRNSAPLAIDGENTLYTCGNLDQGYGPIECQALPFGSEAPRWAQRLEGLEIAGGALAPGRLYVTTTDGYLHALGSPRAAVAARTEPPAGEATEADPGMGAVVQPPEERQTPVQPAVALLHSDPQGYAGGPAVSSEGEVFLVGNGGHLHALGPDGEVVWQADLPDQPVGGPTLSGDAILVVDRTGVSALGRRGERLWRYEQQVGRPISGAAVAANGRIFYTLIVGTNGAVQALSSRGEPLWQTPLRTFNFYETPLPAPDGSLVFFQGEVFRAADGSPVDLNFGFKPDRIFVGQDGNLYLRLENTVAPWSYADGQAALGEARVSSTEGAPEHTGVAASGVVWWLYRSFIFWFQPDGAALGSSFARNAFLQIVAGVDRDGTVYACGRKPFDFRQNPRPYCMAFSPDRNEALWEVQLGDGPDDYEFAGAVLAQRALFVATEGGNFYRLGSGEAP